ncbi:MAG: sigma-70 family RNA polymerase sigma factor, partial [Bacteroidales bacterium]|nr:sigma-70 family RNA polymerase sigma factor [Bacteroidales bacterium]
MKLTMSFEDFQKKYYLVAISFGELKVKKHIAKNGLFDPSVDVEMAVVEGAFNGLEKAYKSYDVDNVDDQSIKKFLYTVVGNAVIDAIRHQGSIAGSTKRNDFENELKFNAKLGGYAGTSDYHERKEEVIKSMIALVKKLDPTSQVIIDCYIKDDKNYIENSIKALGMEDNKSSRNIVAIRFNRAKKKLAELMGGKKPDYRDMYISVVP